MPSCVVTLLAGGFQRENTQPLLQVRTGGADLPRYDVIESHCVFSHPCITPIVLFTGYIGRHVSTEPRFGVEKAAPRTCFSEGFFFLPI